MSQIEKVEIQRLSSEAVLPTRAYPDDAGLDLYSLEKVSLEPASGVMASTGIAIAIPQGHVGLVMDRSSLAKKGFKTAGGIIDAGYRGELKVVLWNLSKDRLEIEKGERLAQLLIVPIATPAVQEVKVLPAAERGAKGFGSSGR